MQEQRWKKKKKIPTNFVIYVIMLLPRLWNLGLCILFWGVITIVYFYRIKLKLIAYICWWRVSSSELARNSPFKRGGALPHPFALIPLPSLPSPLPFHRIHSPLPCPTTSHTPPNVRISSPFLSFIFSFAPPAPISSLLLLPFPLAPWSWSFDFSSLLLRAYWKLALIYVAFIWIHFNYDYFMFVTRLWVYSYELLTLSYGIFSPNLWNSS